MADASWLKNLATSRYHDGTWHPEDPSAVQTLADERIRTVITELKVLADDFAETLSAVTSGRRTLKVLTLASPDIPGFLLLMERSQLVVTGEKGLINVTMIKVHGFSRQKSVLARLAPRTDAFGAVLWCPIDQTGRPVPMGLLMTPELIMKRLVEEITKAAWESGDLRTWGERESS